MSGILDLSLAELADAIYMRKVSSREATEASIAAFERHGERLNAVVDIDAEGALEQAAAMDAELQAGRRRGRLHGVPLAHKDMFYRAGRPSVCGTIVRRDFVPQVTSTALARLDGAGALDIGRLNMVEFALGITGHNRHTGHPRNPWNTDHITGGSSSGPVASVAARLVPASLGSDTGGSIRVPACCTGLVGLKPTYGRISCFGAMPLSQSLDHVGIFTRTARDTAILLGILAGHDPADPLSSRHRVPDYENGLEEGLEGLRVGYVASSDEVDMSDEVLSLLAESRAVLADLGAELVEINLPDLAPINTLRRCLMFSEATAHHLDFLDTVRDQYTTETLSRMEPGLESTRRATCVRKAGGASPCAASWPKRWPNSMSSTCRRCPSRSRASTIPIPVVIRASSSSPTSSATSSSRSTISGCPRSRFRSATPAMDCPWECRWSAGLSPKRGSCRSLTSSTG
ncbi:MAG: amidase [Geminicoccaceae bacterium]